MARPGGDAACRRAGPGTLTGCVVPLPRARRLATRRRPKGCAMGREAPAEAAPWNVQALPAPKGVISVGGEMLAEAPAWAVFGVVTNYAKLPRLGGRLEMCEVLESLDDCTTKIKQARNLKVTQS